MNKKTLVEVNRALGVERYPTFIQFETSTDCNASCLMCPHKTMDLRPTMSWENIQLLIQKVAPFVQGISPFGTQEPFVEPRISEIIDYIKLINPLCKVGVYTNLGTSNWSLIKKVIDSQKLDELIISFYGPTKELYNKYQPGLDFHTTLTNISRLKQYRDSQKYQYPKIYLHYLCIPDLMEHRTSVENKFRPFYDEFSVFPFDTFHGDIPYIGDNAKHYNAIAEHPPCELLWQSMVVVSTGDVVPCCLDYNATTPCGNILTDDLTDVWRGSTLDDIRQKHLDGKQHEISLCKNCTRWVYGTNPEWAKFWNIGVNNVK